MNKAIYREGSDSRCGFHMSYVEREANPPSHRDHEQSLRTGRYTVLAKRFDNIGQLVDWTGQLRDRALFTKVNRLETLLHLYHVT